MRETRTVVVAIPQDEVYMTLLDPECLGIWLETDVLCTTDTLRVCEVPEEDLRIEFLEERPTDQLLLRVYSRNRSPQDITLYLEEIDDGTRLFFHLESLQSDDLPFWTRFLERVWLHPLQDFFAEEIETEL